MLSFYRNLKDRTGREALRLAQIKTRSRYPHPSLWAAFQIVGKADVDDGVCWARSVDTWPSTPAPSTPHSQP